MTFTGFDGAIIVMVSVAHVTAPGTFSLAYLNVQGSSAMVSTATEGWDTFFSGGAGSVTFTTFTTHHAVGTFSFVAVPGIAGTTGNMPVTNGKFDVTF